MRCPATGIERTKLIREHQGTTRNTMNATAKKTDADVAEMLEELFKRFDRLEAAVKVMNATAPGLPSKEWYSVAEAAAVVGKSPWTIRQMCKLKDGAPGKIYGEKRLVGQKEVWVIPAEEVQRVRNFAPTETVPQ
jgi:hypothetical protein